MLEIKPEITYGDLLAATLTAITLVGIPLGFIYTQILQSTDDRKDAVAFLRRGYVRGFYQGGVNWLMCGLQKLYGNAESLQAFNVSLLLAYFYPFLFFLWAYSKFDGGVYVPNSEVLAGGAIDKKHYFLMLVFSMAFMVLVFKKLDDYGGRFGVFGRFLSRFVSIVVLSMWVSELVEYLPDLVLLVPTFLFLPTVLVFSAKPVYSGVNRYSYVITGFFTIIFAMGFIGLAQYIGAYKSSIMIAFFYLMLPLVNALLDWLSWWVSRWFLERAAQEPQVRIIVLDVVLDFGAAVLFMLALCLLLPAGAILLDNLYVGWVDVNTGVPAQTGWQEYAVWARDEPWGKGIMVTLMLVTTLIPTLLHILLGLMAFFIHGFKGAALADFLEQPRKNWRDAIASVWMLGYPLAAVLAMLGVWQLLQHFAQLPIAHWLYNFTGYFYELP